MELLSDPGLVTVKVTIPGQDGNEDVTRKFKFTLTELQRDVIHHTVIIAFRVLSSLSR